VNRQRVNVSPYDSRQRCLICALVEDLIDIAEADLHIGRFDDVGGGALPHAHADHREGVWDATGRR
jgi:hypothetical protein